MYVNVGNYTEALEPLIGLANNLEVYWNVEGYGMSRLESPEVLNAFAPLLATAIPGAWRNAMLSILPPGTHVPFHKDSLLDYSTTRYHLVLQTNARCRCFHDGEWQRLVRGGIYTMNPLLEHAAVNDGDSARIHLIIDSLS